jgi:glucose/arabinose dehydrogenase
VSGLASPIAFVQDPSQPNVQLVAEQGGRIRVVQSGALLPTDFLDLTNVVLFAGEQGLLGLAFAPDYASSRRFYVNFVNKQGHTVIARFLRMATDQLRADPSSRFDLVWPDGLAFITQPFSNHKGGNIAFGPDGLLYIGMGDGGGGNDPFHNAQNPMSLLGKMLRIDVSVSLSNAKGYAIPPSNPFFNQPGVLGEIWAFGYRNPWRWSFDDPSRGGTGAMIVGDVGQSAFEEIDYEPAGAGGRNYGWRNREGAHDNVTTMPPFSTPLIDPIHEYGRTDGIVVAGGFVYRGGALGGAYVGRYFFADVGFSRVWSLALSIHPITGEATAFDLKEHTAELGVGAQVISSFGVDSNGELYTVGLASGQIYRISPGAPPPGPTDGTCTTPMPDPTWTCFGGNWYPPGMPIPGAAPTPPPPSTTPPPPTGCTTPQPGVDWICANGNWYPPDMPIPGGAPTSPPPPPTTTPPPPPPSTGCTTPQPGVDWICANGNWYPPDMPIPGGAPTSPPPPPTTPPSPASCPGSDPFLGIPGLAGVCINGNWIPTELIQSMATVQFNSASGGFWELRLDDGRVFVPMGGLSPAFQTAGRRVTITGKVRIDLASVPGPIIELLSIQ